MNSMNIKLAPMTLALCNELYQNYQEDINAVRDMNLDKPFVYSKAWVEDYYHKQQTSDRVVFVVYVNDMLVGEVKLYNIKYDKRECTLGILLQSEKVRNKGIGTFVEKMIIDYAFNELNMEVVYGNALNKNTRSCKVLEKVGFQLLYVDDEVHHYE